jgi:hypothetical protein
MVTSLIQADAVPAIALAKPGSADPGSGFGQGSSFATALQSAANRNSPLRVTSPAKPETQPKLSEGQRAPQSQQPILSPVAVLLIPAPAVPVPPVPALKIEGSVPQFSSLPGKVGQGDDSQLEGSEPPVANNIGHPSTTIVPSSTVTNLGLGEAVPSDAPTASVTPAPVAPSVGTPKAFTNPAGPITQVTQSVALPPSGPISASSAFWNSELPPPAQPAAGSSANPSLAQPIFNAAPPTDLAPEGVPNISTLMAAPTEVASGSELDSGPGSQERAPAVLLSATLVAASVTVSVHAAASVPVAIKPLRVLDTEARRATTLPVREAMPNATVFPQISRAMANVPASPEVPKAMAAPAPLKVEAGALSAPILDPSKDFQGPYLSPTADSAGSEGNTPAKGKASIADSSDAAAPSPASPPDSPAPQPPIENQPDTLPLATPIAAIPASPAQNPGSPAPATSVADPSAQHPIQTSLEPATNMSGSIQTARVVQGVAQSEMHIGFRSPAFGSVEVHTAVRDAQLGLAVSSERGDLRGFLAQEVPGLQNVFHQQGLQFDQIRFVSPGSGTGTGFSTGSDPNANSPGNGRNPKTWFSQDAAAEPDSATAEIQVSTTRLSVHA